MAVNLTEKYVQMSKDIFAATGEKWNPNFLFLTYEIGNYNHLVLQGGTRSGKTFSTVQWMWKNLEECGGTRYSIVRQSSPVLKSTVMMDFKEIGLEAGIYAPVNHNLTENVYRHNSNMIDFFGVEEEEKVRGRKRDVLYLNEAPELGWDVVLQLLFRTSSKKIYDFNPSMPDSWLYDNIMTRDDCAYIITTYKDNPYVTAEQIAEIEWLRDNDPEMYKVFGMGERGNLQGQIYHGWIELEEDRMPKDGDVFVLDFGYSVDPTGISKLKFDGDRDLYIKELVYETELDNVGIAVSLFFHGFRNGKHYLVADSAEPKSIGELRFGWDFKPDYVAKLAADLGFEFTKTGGYTLEKLCDYLKEGLEVIGAIKGSDSIANGIQKVRQYNVFYCGKNIKREYHKYKWKVDQVTGKITKKPDPGCPDHLLDGIRYGVMSKGRIY